jgi:hypothetical protein
MAQDSGMRQPNKHTLHLLKYAFATGIAAMMPFCAGLPDLHLCTQVIEAAGILTALL